MTNILIRFSRTTYQFYFQFSGSVLYKYIQTIYIYVYVFKTQKITQFYLTFCFTAFSNKVMVYRFMALETQPEWSWLKPHNTNLCYEASDDLLVINTVINIG